MPLLCASRIRMEWPFKLKVGVSTEEKDMRLVCRFALAIASLSIITSISGVVVPLKAAAIDTPLTAGPLNAPGMPKAGQIAGNTSLEQVLLSRARANSADLASSLANFVCRERMERFRAAHGESV